MDQFLSTAHIVIEELSETPPVEDIIPSVRESATPSPDTKGVRKTHDK